MSLRQSQTVHVVFDLGSSIDAISPHFMNASSIKVFELEYQEHLQLSTIGDLSINTWRDVMNIDKYAGIIGSWWMRQNKVILDYV